MKTPMAWQFALLLLALASPIAAQTPAQVVGQYIAARAAGQYDKAYALLSPATRNLITYSRYSSAHYKPQVLFPVVDARLQNEQTRKNLAEGFAPVRAFFLDSHKTQGLEFAVVDASTKEKTVFVRVLAKGQRVEDGPLIPVVTIQGDGADTTAPRIDFPKTVHAVLLDRREKDRQTLSRLRLRMIGICISQFSMDHDDSLPDADRWMDEIMPYIKDESFFHDPSDPAGKKWGYAFNRNLSGVKLAQVDDPAATVAVYEGTANIKNASDRGTSIPSPGRHLGGTDYLFNDGHVKWLPDGAKPSYLLSGK